MKLKTQMNLFYMYWDYYNYTSMLNSRLLYFLSKFYTTYYWKISVILKNKNKEHTNGNINLSAQNIQT